MQNSLSVLRPTSVRFAPHTREGSSEGERQGAHEQVRAHDAPPVASRAHVERIPAPSLRRTGQAFHRGEAGTYEPHVRREDARHGRADPEHERERRAQYDVVVDPTRRSILRPQRPGGWKVQKSGTVDCAHHSEPVRLDASRHRLDEDGPEEAAAVGAS